MILIILFSIMFFISFFYYLKIDREIKSEQIIKNKLINIAVEPKITDDENKYINFKELKKINNDIVAWIEIEGTNVNYPIVQGKDNSFYLNHNFERKYNSLGSIFMDYSAVYDFSDKNTFIYGHNTKNGSMFGDLKKYKDEVFFKEHPFFFIYTDKTIYKVLIFSVYVDDANSDSYIYKFANVDDYNSYLNKVKEKSIYKINLGDEITLDKIITLYTCAGGEDKNSRLYLHGVLTKSIVS